MVDKELIEIWRNMLKPSISSRLLKTNYEGKGEQDKEEFERDFDEILDLALIGLKHKAQLSQEDATKDATSDTISRQAAIGEVKKHYRAYDNDLLELITFDIERLPSAQPDSCDYWDNESHYCALHRPAAQPEERTKKRTETRACD